MYCVGWQRLSNLLTPACSLSGSLNLDVDQGFLYFMNFFQGKAQEIMIIQQKKKLLNITVHDGNVNMLMLM